MTSKEITMIDVSLSMQRRIFNSVYIEIGELLIGIRKDEVFKERYSGL